MTGFSDSDWTREPAVRARPTAAQRWWLAAMAALTVLAAALAWFGIEEIVASRARTEALRHASTPTPTPTPTSTPTPASPATTASSAAAAPRPAPAASAATATDAVPDEAAVDRAQLEALEAELRQRAREAARQAALEAARRKERAWERWYARPAFCNDNPTSAQMIECANHHIRARRQFEDLWAAGRL